MDSIGFKIENWSEFQKKLDEMTAIDRHEFFATEFKPIGDTLVTAMRNQTPVSKSGTKGNKKYITRNHPAGRLRASIGKKVGGGEIPVVWVSLNRVRSQDAWYQHIVVGGWEYGGTRHLPNPIVRRTWDAMQAWVEGQLKTRMGRKLKAMIQ